MNYTIDLSDVANEQVRNEIVAPLIAYNISKAGPNDGRPLVITIRDSHHKIIGGLWGNTGFQWLFTQLLLVPESLRGRGLGADLMHRAEAEAVDRGCHGAWLDSFEPRFGSWPLPIASEAACLLRFSCPLAINQWGRTLRSRLSRTTARWLRCFSWWASAHCVGAPYPRTASQPTRPRPTTESRLNSRPEVSTSGSGTNASGSCRITHRASHGFS